MNNVKAVTGRFEQVLLEGLQIGSVLGDPHDRGGTGVRLQKGHGLLHPHLIHFMNNPLGMRKDHLRAIFKIDLVAIVMGRIVAGRYNHASGSP